MKHIDTGARCFGLYIITSHHWSWIYPNATLRAEYWRTHGDQTFLEPEPLNVDSLCATDKTTLSDGALIRAVQAGDDQAGEILVRTHAPWMIAVAQGIAGSPMLAEECVQEAFINVFRKSSRTLCQMPGSIRCDGQ